MEKDDAMSTAQVRKPKPESYEYSWFLPAGGHNGSAIVHQLPPSELEAASAQVENPEIRAMEARTEQWRHSGATRSRSAQLQPWKLDQARLRLAGVVAWSGMAAIGAILMVARTGPFPGLQVGILGGVWAGISAAIWFVPQILSR